MTYYFKCDLIEHELSTRSSWGGYPQIKTHSITLKQASRDSSDVLSDIWLAGAQPFTKLKICTSLEEFKISGVRLNDLEVQRLSHALSFCKNLKSITLDNVQLTDNGVKFLASNLLAQNSFIEEINLPNNTIGNQGVDYLVEALGNKITNHTKVINLSNNKIQAQGYKEWIKGELCGLNELFKMLEKKDSHVQTLDLSNNGISEEFLKASIDILEKNHSLTDIKLAGTQSGAGIISNYTNLAERNKAIKLLENELELDASSAISLTEITENNSEHISMLGVDRVESSQSE